MAVSETPKFALSIKQPWATLALLGLKTIEIRRWPVGFRGRIYLHAGKLADDRREGWDRVPTENMSLTDLRGGIVGSIDLVDCLTYSTGRQFARDRQLHFNDPSWFLPPRMFGFRFENPEIVPFRRILGQIKLFPVPPPKANKTKIEEVISQSEARVRRRRVTFEIQPKVGSENSMGR